MKSGDELDDLIREMQAYFVVPQQAGLTFAEFDTSTGALCSEYQAVAKAFRHNIAAALSTVSIPYELAYASAEYLHREKILISARIHAEYLEEEEPQPGEDIEAFRERKARDNADSRMGEFIRSDLGPKILKAYASGLLITSIRNGGLEVAAQELLQQGLVLLWSSFEVLCRDAFEALLNGDPDKIKELMAQPTTRKRFEAERLTLDTLLQHGFDLSRRLGTVLVEQQDFSNLSTIKAVYSVLYPNGSELREALAYRELWALHQRRHLIVHRRGVIDQSYLELTGETHAIGTQLFVVPADVESALRVVVSAGTALARCLPVG